MPRTDSGPHSLNPISGRSSTPLDEFERWVEEALEELPEPIRRVLDQENIPIQVRARPPEDLQREIGGVVFGVFIGMPYGDRSYRADVTEPTRIELYEQPLRQYTRGRSELQQQVRSTVLHEVGHYLGFEEEELRRWE